MIRSVGDAGHEVGVHGWDHIKWHDRAVRMPEEDIAAEYGAAHREFERIFGRSARASAAPGWQASPTTLTVQDRFGIEYASNTRLGAPFFPEFHGRRFNALEIPTTLPTWDETYNSPEFASDDAFIAYYTKAVQGTEVHSIHTEVEATALLPLFERQLEAWRADGVGFVTMEADRARGARGSREGSGASAHAHHPPRPRRRSERKRHRVVVVPYARRAVSCRR